MIQAVVEGRKTQTRRVIKPQPTCQCEGSNWKGQSINWIGYKHEGKMGFFCHKCGSGLQEIDEWSSHGILPRYHAGETVYTKEAWALTAFPLDCWHVLYKDGQERQISPPQAWLLRNKESLFGKWRTPLFMPEWAARRYIKILAVRAERLQEITYGDCITEGIEEILEYPDDVTNNALRRIGAEEVTKPYHMGWRNYQYRRDKRYKWYDPNPEPEWFAGRPDLSFKSLWNSINPKYPFKSNPWVFPYEFELVKGA